MGVKVMLITQLLPAASEPGQVLVCEKLADAAMLAMVKEAVPELVSDA
jgi:fructose-specific component phosphotransferase system IIB-like protein